MLSIVETIKYFGTILFGKRLKLYTHNNNLTCKHFNNDRVFFILEEYGTNIEYIKGDKYIVANAISRFSLNGNQETTQDSTHKKGIVSEINHIKEVPECICTINLKWINKYQRKYPSLLAKYKYDTY